MEDIKLLDTITSPKDLASLTADELALLSREIREFLVDHVGQTGGHLASNLGVVELTIALHRVFDTPHDRIIFDVGHQSYVHKILTGRRDAFSTLRSPGGLSGFTRREESEYDPFGAGHSSTSISAAIGFARGDVLAGRDRYTVAVIGDGAYTGGMVHEAMNNIEKDMKLIIVLNENEMSISPNIGSFARYIARIRSSRSYRRAKRNTTSLLMHIPLIGRGLFRLFRFVKKCFKNLLFHSNYFEELGLFYIGPLDGNDLAATERALQLAREKGEPSIVHLRTKKGKGHPPAEEDPGKYHSISPAPSASDTFSTAFGEELCRMAAGDEKILAVTAAMGVGTGLELFAAEHSDRYFDVGIAEPHAFTFAAGLAASGYRPYVAVYSTFLQRAYDNIIHDIALQRLPVHIMIDRAGLARSDGATHHGIFDVALLSHIPGLTLLSPAALGSLAAMMTAMHEADAPVAIRYPNRTDSPLILKTFYPKGEYGEYGVRSDGTEGADAVIVTYGMIVEEALAAKELLLKQGIRVSVLLAEQLAPYDVSAQKIAEHLRGEMPVLFLEEGAYNGGAALIWCDLLLAEKMLIPGRYAILAIRDDFVIPSAGQTHFEKAGIDRKAILREIMRLTGHEKG